MYENYSRQGKVLINNDGQQLEARKQFKTLLQHIQKLEQRIETLENIIKEQGHNG